MWIVYTPADSVVHQTSIIFAGTAQDALAAVEAAIKFERENGWPEDPKCAREVILGINYVTDESREGPVALSPDGGMAALRAAAAEEATLLSRHT
jgi:hypothetical protein